MKYFRIFNLTSDYEAYMETEEAIKPNISYCSGDNTTYISTGETPQVDVTGVTISTASTTINVGATKTLVATVLPISATDKAVTWSSNNTSIATVSNEGVVTAVASGECTITVTTHDGGYTASCDVTVVVPVATTLVIEGAPSISAETCGYNAIADNSEDVTTYATWSITNGSQYATINSSTGIITILNGSNESSVTIQAIYGGLTATTTVTLTYVSGATSETETESTIDIGGNTTTVTTTVTTYEDGSLVEVEETVVTDVNGNVIGTSESNKTTNADGSYNGNTTNYDAEGNPTDGSNVTGDTVGNVSTQSVEYDASGNTLITGYDIDTTESTGKTFNGDGANTEYYAFDVTHGFELEMHFTVDCSNKPAGQNQNHHNILTAKRAAPEPWYGFQMRQSSTNKFIQLGTQFNTGANTNTTINPASITGSVAEYSLKIIYNPTLTANTFICRDMINNTDVYTSDGTFPDLEALRYLKVLIGYAVDENENPYRYSDINVFNFSLKRLKNVANPTISCSENVVTITCATANSDIYYRFNLSGEYSAYTTTFTITADTVVQAYAVANGDTSDIVEQTCTYVIVIATPTITCDGEGVTLTCATAGATIYYRLNESGSYSAYTAVIPITADTVVEAYAELNGSTSHTAKQTCYYVEGVDEPVITCDGKHVTITCDTVGADIYYRLNDSGNYSAYTTALKITANTVVQAYSELGGHKDSDIVREVCEYDPTPLYRWHAAEISEEWVCSGDNKYYKEYYQISYDDETWENVSPEQTRTGELYEAESDDCIDFSARYFTIESLEDSNVITINVHSSTTGNTAYYSTDSGSSWTAIASGSGSKSIATINSGDTIWIKATSSTSGQQAKWATDYNKNSYFNSTKAYKVYGNAMSLLVGENFATADTITETFALCGIFYGGNNASNLIQAKNLVLPATTVTRSSYNGLFRGCAKLESCPAILPALRLYQDTYSSMFEGCRSLPEGPEIMATTIDSTGATTAMGRMFCMDRKSMVTAAMTKSPVLRITNVIGNAYKEMFKGNGNITEITILAEGTNLSFDNWLSNTPVVGVINKKTATTFTSGASGLPSGWTTENID